MGATYHQVTAGQSYPIDVVNRQICSYSSNKIKVMFLGSTKEKFNYHNTLLCLVNSLQGENITVDLRNDFYVCGQLGSVDGFMNLSFLKAVYCDTKGNEYYFDNLFIQARNVRYVHIPETISIMNNIKKELAIGKPARSLSKTVPKSRKIKKAMKQHMETVASLDNAEKI